MRLTADAAPFPPRARDGGMSTTPQGLFRQESIEHYNRGEIQGNLLQLTPFWGRTTYWVVVALALCLGLMLAVVNIHEYAQGPLLIQVQGVEDITATAGGRVTRILVGRGQQVRAGDPLVELHARSETAERDRVAQEFRARLAARLMDSLNASARQALGSLRAQMDLSEVLVSERTLVAPCDGWVREVRRQMGVVLQNPMLFRGDIRRNIAYQDPSLSMEQVTAAAMRAQVRDDIMAMPMQYNSILSEMVGSLSGGQRQRLALARALVHDPAVLLLDEATNALDVKTERAVQKALEELRCTRVVIAHRLSTIRDANVILVMDKGRLMEQGTHSELLGKGGLYRELVAAQDQSAA